MASTAASDPFLGTWKLDHGKSKYSTGAPPREMTIRIEQQGESLIIEAEGVDENGARLSVKYSLPVKDGPGEVEHGYFDAVNSKYLSGDVRETTYLKNGKQLLSRHTTLADDGKTMLS